MIEFTNNELVEALDLASHGDDRRFLAAALAAVIEKYAQGEAKITMNEALAMPRVHVDQLTTGRRILLVNVANDAPCIGCNCGR